jgi:membrane dipeptidase
MNRRQFLHYSFVWGGAFMVGNLISSCAQAPIRSVLGENMKDLRIIDAHAHPDQFYHYKPISSFDRSSSLDGIVAIGMAASSFSLVGDLGSITNGYYSGSEYYITRIQLTEAERLAKKGKVKLVLKSSDVPQKSAPGLPPGAILSIEGGDPLEGRVERVYEFYRLGVRMITLVHYNNNELGDIMMGWKGMPAASKHNGLSQAGRKVVERMQDLGIMVDVAHASSTTLRQVADMSARPLVDSHTSLCHIDDSSKCWRSRTWNDMERVAKTGGVVCTWPLGYKREPYVRNSYLDWAREILAMKERLGIEHVGLGTDGGGGVTPISGYRDVRDLVNLIDAMKEVGLSSEDIKYYMGGNLYRILQQCIG